MPTQPIRTKWRLAWLGSVLLVVLYLAALSALQTSTAPFSYGPEKAAVLGGGALVLLLLGMAIAAARRNLRSAGAVLAFSLALSISVAAVLFVILTGISGRPGPPESLYRLGSLAREALYGYWPTLAALLGLVFFTLFHADARSLVDSLIPIPVFVWGIDATLSHHLAFAAHAHEIAFYVQVYWLGTIVAAAVLLVVLTASALWRSALGMRLIQPGLLAPIAATVAAVFADWSFSLFTTSMTAIGYWSP